MMSSFELACNQTLSQQYSEHMELFETVCFIFANAVAFGYEAKDHASKSKQDIAREKAMASLQTQCLMKGAFVCILLMLFTCT